MEETKVKLLWGTANLFSRRRPVNPEAMDLALHLRTMQDLRASSLRGGSCVEMQLGADLWQVEVDAGEMELAIVNLCVNARDAMPSGGTVTITAENVREAADDGSLADFVRLSVGDTGTGIPPEILGRVFDPFFTTKDVGKGSGLGLAQVYGFAQQSRGRVSIASEPGSGTVVTLLLPRSTQQPASAPKPEATIVPTVAAIPAAHRGDVLLVEDDREVAALAREMLGELGFSVIHVSTSVAALGALANARAIEAVFSDIMMPGGINGLDLAREIRKRHPRLPIVLATGYAESAASLKDGEFRVLLKPYTLEALADALGVDTELK
jgi:CheY-like chemotaxis protein